MKKNKHPWSTKATMEQIYQKQLWGGKVGLDGFYSGNGSHDLELIFPYLEAVIQFLQSFKTKISLCDLGCGDFNIGSSLVEYSRFYIGVDIVSDLIERNKNYVDSIIRDDMKGEWIVITNPDDILAFYLQINTNIPYKNITALGIALDNMRAKHLGISEDILGQHNLNIYTKENVDVDEVADIPYEIIRKKGFTKYGIGYVVLWYLKYLKNYKHQIISRFVESKNLFESTKLK